MMAIEIPDAMEYIRQNFNLPGCALRMCESIFEYLDCNKEVSNPDKALLDLLDGIGFEQKDLSRMQNQSIIH